MTDLDAWTYTAGSAFAPFGGPEAELTRQGRVFRIVLRVLSPILLGLAVLSVRGRVKR